MISLKNVQILGRGTTSYGPVAFNYLLMNPKIVDGKASTLILLVDDDDTHRYALSKHLHHSGFEVIDAKSGIETLNQALEYRPEAILLDIHLPDLDGFNVCARLKANPDTKQIPVIFHSAVYDTTDARASAQALGAAAFLSYPIDANHLVNVLLGAMARRDHAQ